MANDGVKSKNRLAIKKQAKKGIDNNTFLKHKEATRKSKEAFQRAKKNVKSEKQKLKKSYRVKRPNKNRKSKPFPTDLSTVNGQNQHVNPEETPRNRLKISRRNQQSKLEKSTTGILNSLKDQQDNPLEEAIDTLKTEGQGQLFNSGEAKIDILKAKGKVQEAKFERDVQKKVYKHAKGQDPTRVANQIKWESKLRVKQDIQNKLYEQLGEDDTLGEGVDLYLKGQRSKQNLKRSFQIGKQTGKLGVKTAKGTYGLGNRFFNLSRGRGFYQTPPELTHRSAIAKKIRLSKRRFQRAIELKKSEASASIFYKVFSGKKSLSKGIQAIVSSPITWVSFVILIVLIMMGGVVAGTPKPAIVQDDKDLTDSWVYMTKLDAEHSKDGNVFYSNIDDVMFYMNHQFDDYKLKDNHTLSKTYEDYLDKLWVDLNGKAPNHELKSMEDLMTTKKSGYYMDKESIDEFNELKETLGYSTLDNPLAFPMETDELVVSRRYGYENQEDKPTFNKHIEIDVVEDEEILSPLSGVVTAIPDNRTIEITDEDKAKVLIKGVKTSRHVVTDNILEGDFLGSAIDHQLIVEYEKKDDDKWVSVNPAFYFPKVSYTQQTILGIDYDTANLSPEVIMLTPKFKTAMKEVGMPEKFLPVVLAMCMQESAGKLPDVMQASESLGLPMNTLGTDASVKQGVKYLWANMNLIGLDLINKDESYLKTAVQAYNFGVGFIPFAKSNGYVYTPELAVAFSMKMSGGTGRYGDSKYIPHVWRYVSSSNGGTSAGNGKFFYPLPNKLNDVSGFDYRYNPITGIRELHLGLDFPVPSRTPVYASEDATIMRNSDVGDSYGINVVLKHSKGNEWTRYAHLSSAKVSVGQSVKRGQVIGYVGSTGMSTGPHLHYEVMTSLYGGHVNPRPYIQ